MDVDGAYPDGEYYGAADSPPDLDSPPEWASRQVLMDMPTSITHVTVCQCGRSLPHSLFLQSETVKDLIAYLRGPAANALGDWELSRILARLTHQDQVSYGPLFEFSFSLL